MTDFDADEPVPAPVKRRFWTTDRVIGWSGATIAIVAAFFPWYVFMNGDKFNIDYIRQLMTRDLPERAGRSVVNVSPSAVGDNDKNRVLPRPDQITTGTVPDEKPADTTDTETELPPQPYPMAPRAFRLLHVVKGQAMIEDATGIYVVRRGDALPDLSKVSDLEERDGTWVIVTDKGTIYGAAGKQQ